MSAELNTHRYVAEQRVLAAWFYEPKFKQAWRPDPSLFEHPGHAAAAEVMAHRGAGLTDSGLVLELQRRRKLDYFGGTEGVHQVIHGTPHIADPWTALRRLRELVGLVALHRGLRVAMAKIEAIESLPDSQSAVTEALRAAAGASGATVLTFQGVLDQALQRAVSPDRRPGCTTGSRLVDKVTGGFRLGQCWVIGADTSWGKSSLLTMVADLNLRRSRRPFVVTLEDEPELYGRRILARRANLNAYALREGTLEYSDIQEATAQVNDAPAEPFMIRGIGRDVESLAAEIRSVILGEGIELVLFDYIQASSCRKDFRGQRRLEVAYAARLVTDAIKESGASGVLFSQITVDPNKKHPDKHSLRETKDLANAAEVVALGYYETDEHDELDRAGLRTGKKTKNEKRILMLDKVKDGRARVPVELQWNKRWQGFEHDVDQGELYDEDPEAAA